MAIKDAPELLRGKGFSWEEACSVDLFGTLVRLRDKGKKAELTQTQLTEQGIKAVLMGFAPDIAIKPVRLL